MTADRKGAARPPLAARTLGNALFNVVPFGWSFAIGLLAIPIVVNRLGVADFGLFGVFSLLLVPATLVNLGFGEATIKYASGHIHRGEYLAAARYVRTTLAMNSIVGFAGGVVIWFFGPLAILTWFKVAGDDAGRIEDCCHLIAASWLFNQLSAVFMGIPVAFQDFRRVALVQMIVTTATTGLGVVFVCLGWGLWGYTLGSVLGNLVAVLAWYMCGRALFRGISLRPTIYPDVWGTSFRFGGWQALAQIGGLLANQSERFLLGVFLNASSLGLYNIALNLEQKAYAVVFKMSEVLFPMFSALSEESPEVKADKLIRATWLLTLLASSILIPLVPLAQPLLSLWINPDISEHAHRTLQFLAVGGTLGCAANASYFFLLGNGHSRLIAELTAVTGIVTLGCALWLLPTYGFTAAALPGIGAMVAQQVVLLRVLRRTILARRSAAAAFLCAAQLPLLTALLVSVGALESGVGGLASTWPRLAATYLCTSLASGTVIVLTSRLTTYGHQHWLDLRQIWQIAQTWMGRARRAGA